MIRYQADDGVLHEAEELSDAGRIGRKRSQNLVYGIQNDTDVSMIHGEIVISISPAIELELLCVRAVYMQSSLISLEC